MYDNLYNYHFIYAPTILIVVAGIVVNFMLRLVHEFQVMDYDLKIQWFYNITITINCFIIIIINNNNIMKVKSPAVQV